MTEDRRAELLTLAQECRRLATRVLDKCPEPGGSADAPFLRSAAVRMLTAKACDSFDGITLLAASGFVNEASVLLRVLLETVVTTEFILKHGDAGVFLYWEGMRDHKMRLKGLLEKGRMNQIFPAQVVCEGIRTLERECQRFDSDLPRAFGGLPNGDILWKKGKKERCRWKDVKIAERFRSTGLQSLYDSVYLLTSLAAHAHSAIQLSYFNPPESADPLVGPKTKYFKETISAACRLLVVQTHDLDGTLGLGLSELIEHQENRVIAIAGGEGK